MKRCTAAHASPFQAIRLGIEGQKRWVTYDKSALTKEALLEQVESGLGYDVDGNPLKVDPETKTVSTATGSLPISPVMDPAWMKARRRQKKNGPTKPSGQFRKKLSNNPYAEALITPIRRCRNSATFLPRYFYQDFELVKHPDPEVSSLWWAPGPLAFDNVMPWHDPNISRSKTSEHTEIESGASESESTTKAHAAVYDQATAENAVATAATTSPVELDATQEALPEEWRPRRAPMTVYILGRKNVIDLLGMKKVGRRLQARMSSPRHGTLSMNKAYERIWRPDMGDVLLNMMRRKAVDALIQRGKRSDGPMYKFIQPCASWDYAKTVDKGGCVLWIPKESNAATAGYATLDVEGANYGGKMAVHDLIWLLGEEEVQRLKDEAEVFRDQEILVLKHWKSKSARSLHLLLWRLQGYLAEPKLQGAPEPVE
ncbi:hypothetical protein FZEAL_2398 [Fusarium zealandicum]|uniref:Esterase-like protein n=1 Tax=Fusarium zealandicum TaxID=1053134 RepID=A0A8H4XNX1_9HYPO|nr:hypothetical protein FZEAL_2398 [Fusarium zealandicum]